MGSLIILLFLIVPVLIIASVNGQTRSLQDSHNQWLQRARAQLGLERFVQGSGYAIGVDQSQGRVAVIDPSGRGQWFPFGQIAHVSAQRLYSQEYLHFENQTTGTPGDVCALVLTVRFRDHDMPVVTMRIEHDVHAAEHIAAQLANAIEESPLKAAASRHSVGAPFSLPPPLQPVRGWWQRTFG